MMSSLFPYVTKIEMRRQRWNPKADELRVFVSFWVVDDLPKTPVEQFCVAKSKKGLAVRQVLKIWS